MIVFGAHPWFGESGRKYKFNVTLTDKGVPQGGGIYVFVRRRFVFFLKPLYIGKATSFRSRVIGHERWPEAWWNRGATERHFLKVEGARDRAWIEEDLIRHYQPVMNDILIPRSVHDAPNNKRLARRWRRKRFWNRFWWGKPHVG